MHESVSPTSVMTLVLFKRPYCNAGPPALASSENLDSRLFGWVAYSRCDEVHSIACHAYVPELPASRCVGQHTCTSTQNPDPDKRDARGADKHTTASVQRQSSVSKIGPRAQDDSWPACLLATLRCRGHHCQVSGQAQRCLGRCLLSWDMTLGCHSRIEMHGCMHAKHRSMGMVEWRKPRNPIACRKCSGV